MPPQENPGWALSLLASLALPESSPAAPGQFPSAEVKKAQGAVCGHQVLLMG